MSGHIKALKYYNDKCAKDEKWKNFKLGLGNEIYLCRNGLDLSNYEKGEKFPHFILVAKDAEGHKLLRELSTRAWSHSFTMFMTRVPTYYKDVEEIVGKNKGHLIASSACFLPGQKVKTRNGYKKIEDIESGDEVRNYKGEWESVIQPTSRLYEGQGYEIYRQGRIEPIRCTDNHKFLVSNNNYIAYSKTKKSVLYWQEAKKLNTASGNKKEFGVRPINTLFTGDYQIFKSNFEHIIFPDSPYSPRRIKLKQIIDITPEVMRLFGLYLGDGCIDCGINPRIVFTFNETEFPVYYEGFVKKALGDIGGNWSINQRPESHRVDLTCSNRDVYELFYYIFGPNHANTKYIPERLKHISKELDEELLFGYLLADGYFRVREKEGYKYGETITASISKQLTEDYIDLFNDLGMAISIYQCEEYIGKDGVHHQKCYYTSMSSFAFGQINKLYPYSHEEVMELFKKGYDDQAKNRITDKNGVEYLRIRIQKIIPIDIDERVYCLNNTTHSFTCENMIVHNCLGGWLGICKANGAEKNAIAFIKWCKSIFGDDFYLELQPARYEEQIEYNKWLLQLGKDTNTKCIITTDSHYLKKEDRDIHASFLNSKDGDRETADFYQYTYVMSSQEIIELTQDYIDSETILELFNNTKEIKDKISYYDLAKPQIVPHLNDDRNKTPWQEWLNNIRIQDKYEYLNKYLTSSYEDDRYYLYLCLSRLQELGLDKDTRDMYIQRLEDECAELWLVSQGIKQPLSAYLLTVRNIVSIIWNEADSIVGPSRGSAGALLGNYLIGITDMNPLTQGVECPVFRFIHRDKIELSDIDIDSEGCRRNTILQVLDNQMIKQGGRSLNVATFGTLGSRSAILTAARGLGIDVDIAQYLSTMIPQERGFLWPLKDCLEGNPDKDRQPIAQLVNEFKKYPELLEVSLGIEGLVCQTGIHASGVCLYNTDIWDYSCSMKAPNGVEITQWDLHDAEYAGSLKFDLLSVESADKIHKCMELLLKDGLMEWQGSLRKTYVKYLHPDVLKRTGEDLWKKSYDMSVIDLFQLEGNTGRQALSIIKPTSLPELAAINSLMRLMPDKGKKTPSEEYAYYKQHPEKLKEEIDRLDGTAKEKEILYNFLKQYHGVCESQENIMLLSMIPEFTNFSYKEANALRKLISKKKMSEIPIFREKFMEAGRKNGCSQGILDYLWDVQVHRQLGYSFSQIHTTAYSLIALQEMNLNYNYPSIYWATACLTVNSGGADEDAKGTTKYGKLSSAIGRIKNQGISVELPDINKADLAFVPDINNNTIIFGLKGISGIGDDLIDKILKNRPYNSLEDFLEKIEPAKTETISLIKAGSFDELEKGKDRKEILYQYISTLVQRKNKLTLANVNALIKYNLLPKNKNKYIYLYNFNKYLKMFKDKDNYLLDDRAYDYYSKNFDINKLSSNKKGTYINMKVWDTIYKDAIYDLKEYIAKNEDKYIDKLYNAEVDELWKEHCDGSISAWEMSTLGFYYHEHELKGVRYDDMKFENYYDMPELPVIEKYVEYKGREIPMYKMRFIVGTVLDKNSYKHTITLLTPNGVVNVKCTGDHYSKYDKQLSQFNPETKRKEVIEKSWFKRGTKLIVAGYRNQDQFMARSRVKDKIYPFYRILDVDDTGQLNVTRYRCDDD